MSSQTFPPEKKDHKIVDKYMLRLFSWLIAYYLVNYCFFYFSVR